MVLRNFRKQDYYGFAGVTGEGKNAPKIGVLEVDVDNGVDVVEMVVISAVDDEGKNGCVSIHSEVGGWAKVTKTLQESHKLAKSLRNGVTVKELKKIGFKSF